MKHNSHLNHDVLQHKTSFSAQTCAKIYTKTGIKPEAHNQSQAAPADHAALTLTYSVVLVIAALTGTTGDAAATVQHHQPPTPFPVMQHADSKLYLTSLTWASSKYIHLRILVWKKKVE